MAAISGEGGNDTTLVVFQKTPGTGDGQCPDALRLQTYLQDLDIKPDAIFPGGAIPRNLRHDMIADGLCGESTPLLVVVGEGGKPVGHLECPQDCDEVLHFLLEHGKITIQ